uniref:SFRICE_007238 n=1 Tax=Spodoptera frugiperda TaxID=7108 RepID=A0A2H1W4P0_SPOFR
MTARLARWLGNWLPCNVSRFIRDHGACNSAEISQTARLARWLGNWLLRNGMGETHKNYPFLEPF